MKTTLPAIAWTVLVLAASSDFFSGAHTASLIDSISIALLGGFSPGIDAIINFAIRKAAHVVEYAVLGLLWFRALRGPSPLRWTLRWAVLAVAIAASVASLDEIHQSFVPSRGGSPWDVLLDTAGATLAQLLLRLRTGQR